MNWIEENKLKRRLSYLEVCYLELSKLIVTKSDKVSLDEFADNMKILRDDKKVTLLDIRTKGEHAVLSIGLKNSIVSVS